MALFEVKNLSIAFGGLKALDDISFAVEKGEIYAIIGPNGAGKTTLFNCINGIYPPGSGQISNSPGSAAARPGKLYLKTALSAAKNRTGSPNWELPVPFKI